MLQSLIYLAVLLGWASSAYFIFTRFADYRRATVALLCLWFVSLLLVWADLPAVREELSSNITLSLLAVGKPVMVGLALATLIGTWKDQRFYVLSIRWAIIGLIGLYTVLEVVANDLLQRGVVVAYVGVLLGYAFAGVVTWQLTRVALTDLSSSEDRDRS